MEQLSHIDESGKATMVDVTNKNNTIRMASAGGIVKLGTKAYVAIKNNEITKGDVISTARIAAIQGAKKTSDLIPLCHNIFISHIDIDFKLHDDDKTIEIISHAKTNAATGIEMEALTAVSIAALTIYDMCKSIDKSIEISNIRLLSKSGGKSGQYQRSENE